MVTYVVVMLKRKSMTMNWLHRLTVAVFGKAKSTEPAWRRDPLAHPELRNLTPDQLSDLPLGPERCRNRGR